MSWWGVKELSEGCPGKYLFYLVVDRSQSLRIIKDNYGIKEILLGQRIKKI